MALQSFTVSIGALRDVNNNDKNYVSGEAIYVKTIGGTFAPIFRDLAGTSEIAQDGLANQTNEKGQFTFFVEAGDYILEYQNQSTPVTIVGADYFNNRVEETVNQIIIDTSTSRGFNNKGTFADGFTYELPNDVGIDASANPWIYNGTLPFTVTAGTTPSSPTYTQVIYGAASQVSTNTSDTVQSFIDSFALKIFQSHTDGGLTEIQTRTVSGGEVYEVRKTSDNSLATIYSDSAGTNEIVQNGTDNKSGSDGVVDFYIADGDYYIVVGGVKVNFNVFFNKKSIIEFGGVDDFDGISGTDNTIALLSAISERPVTVILPKTQTGIYFFADTTSSEDLDGVTFAPDDGVEIYLPTDNITNLMRSAGARSTKAMKITVGGSSYFEREMSNQMELSPSEKQVATVDSEYEIAKVDKLAFTSDFTFKTFRMSGAWPNTSIGYSDTGFVIGGQGDSVTFTSQDQRFDGVLFHAVTGDHIQALNSGGRLNAIIVQTSNGWVQLRDRPSYDGYTVTVNTNGTGVEHDQARNLIVKEDYIENSLVGVHVLGERDFVITINGVAAYRHTTDGAITHVGWSSGFNASTGETVISSPSRMRYKKGVAVNDLKIVTCGDSTGDNAVCYQSQFSFAAQYLNGTGGCQVTDHLNLAFRGDTISAQKTKLLATDITGFDYCLIQLGINDIQNQVYWGSSVNLLVDMVNYCKSSNVIPIVGVPAMFYERSDIPSSTSHIGVDSKNAEMGSKFRSELFRKAGEVGFTLQTLTFESLGHVTPSYLINDNANNLLMDNIHPDIFASMQMGHAWAKIVYTYHSTDTSHASDGVGLSTYNFTLGGQNRQPKYTVSDCGKYVNISGYISRDSQDWTSSDFVVGTLPSRLRPSNTITYLCNCRYLDETPLSELCNVIITSDGSIRVLNAPAATALLPVDISYPI